ncbi:38.7K [Samia ricini nucleopolyhedrovirus]|nr:38.7K [Samia ricini nucleopolyhedrovirus]BBD51355.1 38.7K [Samia ricini nucleopolyhedrovirus]BBD51507.1 38.7K [Samia ricini nucleopolyhedrovirus]
MFDWVRGWWANGAVAFDARAYKRYAVDRRAHSDLVRWDVFRCHPFTFEFRYVADDAGRHFNLVDFCKGLQISHDLLPRCRWDCARHLNEIALGAPPTAFAIESAGSLFATKHGLVQFLQQLPFTNKEQVLLAIRADRERDDMREKIESVLKHVKTLSANSDKFINSHKSFKLAVNARFEHLEQRLQKLDVKLQAPSERDAAPGVVFPRDVTKHEHLAVFMSGVEERGSTQIAFARGQQEHFRKRKLQFEESMDVMFEGVHPSPVMAVNRIKEELFGSGHKVRRLSKHIVEVKCSVAAAKDIVKKAIL